jgi:hypothetical protein
VLREQLKALSIHLLPPVFLVWLWLWCDLFRTDARMAACKLCRSAFDSPSPSPLGKFSIPINKSSSIDAESSMSY